MVDGVYKDPCSMGRGHPVVFKILRKIRTFLHTEGHHKISDWGTTEGYSQLSPGTRAGTTQACTHDQKISASVRLQL